MSTADKPAGIVYLARPDVDEQAVRILADQNQILSSYYLARRGYAIGWLGMANAQARMPATQEKQRWRQSEAVFWPGALAEQLSSITDQLEQSFHLYLKVLDGASCADLIAQAPYQNALEKTFQLVSCSYDESDLQQIERLDFEPISGVSSDDIDSEVWMKASWLSYEEDDASLRFRFSFGMDGYEDVAADAHRQSLTSQLAQQVFPESRIITENERLARELGQLLDVDAIEFVERIVYFNAPDGGAQFHQDVERGHLGVIFAQMSGRTAWFALPKKQLIQEIIEFLARADVKAVLLKTLDSKLQKQLFKNVSDPAYLNTWLDQRDNDALDILINQTPAFSQQLADHGHAYVLHPGDVLLLPQHGMDDCAWHSVFCLDDEPGQALSFAMKRFEQK